MSVHSPFATTFLSHVSLRQRRRAQRMLACAPWCWPPAGTPQAASLTAAGLERPALRPGQCLLVGVSADDQAAQVAALGIAPPFAGELLGFAPDVARVRADAHTAVQRTAPLRLHALKGLAACSPVPLGGVSLGGGCGDEVVTKQRSVLTGASYGLALALRAASWSADVPLRVEVAALAGINARGQVTRVDGLRSKVRALAALCPSVTKVLVAEEQADEVADQLAGLVAAPTLVAVASLGQALEQALAQSTEVALRGVPQADRSATVSRLFRLTLDGHDVVSHWRGVASAAQVMVDAWTPSLSRLDADKLAFAAAVASRHAGIPEQGMPAWGWQSALPRELRQQILAHVVQDASDRGSALAQGAREDAASLVANADPGSGACKVLGAWGRFLAVSGQPREALALQQRAARQWLELALPEQASRPLCEWMRLAGALGDRSAAEAARAFDEELDAAGGAGAANRAYLDLARWTLALRLAAGQHPPAITALSAMVADVTAPPHVRLSAARWLLRFGSDDARSLALSALREGPDATANHRQLFLALGDLSVSDEALYAAVAAVVPGALSTLHDAYGDQDRAATLRRWFPY